MMDQRAKYRAKLFELNARLAAGDSPDADDPPSKLPVRRKPAGKSNRPDVVRIDPNEIYTTKFLEKMLGRTIWRTIKRDIRPLIKSRYAGGTVLSALDAMQSARVVDIVPQAKAIHGGREKRHARIQGSDKMRVCFSHSKS